MTAEEDLGNSSTVGESYSHAYSSWLQSAVWEKEVTVTVTVTVTVIPLQSHAR